MERTLTKEKSKQWRIKNEQRRLAKLKVPRRWKWHWLTSLVIAVYIAMLYRRRAARYGNRGLSLR